MHVVNKSSPLYVGAYGMVDVCVGASSVCVSVREGAWRAEGGEGSTSREAPGAEATSPDEIPLICGERPRIFPLFIVLESSFSHPKTRSDRSSDNRDAARNTYTRLVYSKRVILGKQRDNVVLKLSGYSGVGDNVGRILCLSWRKSIVASHSICLSKNF
ncbi:unnamed protein product, partial [Iphiclides podalirius]